MLNIIVLFLPTTWGSSPDYKECIKYEYKLNESAESITKIITQAADSITRNQSIKTISDNYSNAITGVPFSDSLPADGDSLIKELREGDPYKKSEELILIISNFMITYLDPGTLEIQRLPNQKISGIAFSSRYPSSYSSSNSLLTENYFCETMLLVANPGISHNTLTSYPKVTPLLDYGSPSNIRIRKISKNGSHSTDLLWGRLNSENDSSIKAWYYTGLSLAYKKKNEPDDNNFNRLFCDQAGIFESYNIKHSNTGEIIGYVETCHTKNYTTSVSYSNSPCPLPGGVIGNTTELEETPPPTSDFEKSLIPDKYMTYSKLNRLDTLFPIPDNSAELNPNNLSSPPNSINYDLNNLPGDQEWCSQ